MPDIYRGRERKTDGSARNVSFLCDRHGASYFTHLISFNLFIIIIISFHLALYPQVHLWISRTQHSAWPKVYAQQMSSEGLH